MTDTKASRSLYDSTQVNLDSKRAIIEILSMCRTYDVITTEVLHSVTWTLLCHSPADACEWFSGKPAPAEMHPSLGMYLDSRGIVVGTWDYFATTLHDSTDYQRQPDGLLALSLDGSEREQVIQSITTPLLTYPFSIALATWFAAWEAWGQTCNVDDMIDQAQRVGWEITQYCSTLKLIAAWVRHLYYIGGW